MSEPRATYHAGPRQRVRRASRGRPSSPRPSGSEAGFPGCKAVPMAAAELGRDDVRIEYWDAADGVAWMVCEPPMRVHERPAHRLPALLDRIAEARGAAIECCGATTFHERGPGGRHVRAMEADQTVYLDAARCQALRDPAVVLGSEAPPDVALEVDHTTDVRRRKLREYERWGFPEVWVEVPERGRGRRARHRPGLTIHVLEGDPQAARYREAAESRALPGWTAAEIHRALNEPERSASTRAALERVGLALRQLEGDAGRTRSDDPNLPGGPAAQAAHAAHAAHAAGKAEATVAMVRQVLAQRGIACSPSFLGQAEAAGIAAGAPAQLVAAALACRSEAGFFEAIAARKTC